MLFELFEKVSCFQNCEFAETVCKVNGKNCQNTISLYSLNGMKYELVISHFHASIVVETWCLVICRHYSHLILLSVVMDVTDIITGKMDDEDKQHFIPFQPWVWLHDVNTTAFMVANITSRKWLSWNSFDLQSSVWNTC